MSSCETLGGPFVTLKNLISNNKNLENAYIIQHEIPIYGGLQEVDDNKSSFDTKLGDVFVMTYSLREGIEIDKVKEFYDKSLLEFGWNANKLGKKNNNLSYKRQNDILEINIDKDISGKTLVRFLILYIN